MEVRFDGKTALVTGAGKGIGRHLTIKLVEAGATVFAISRTQYDLDTLKKEVKNSEKIRTFCLDIGQWESTQQALKGIGPVDMLINNAGILENKEFGELSEEEVNRTLDINVKSIINITQMIAKDMKARGRGGSIVHISSILAMCAIPGYGVYCASKGAVDQLTRTMAIEYGPHQIRVNSVNPTVVRTSMAEKLGLLEEGNEQAEKIIGRTPLRRFAELDDIVGPVFFLLSDYAAMITGTVMPVDGGLFVCYV